jgi:hypothetical protein
VKNTLFFILILCLGLATSCGNNPDEEAYQAIDEALTLLSSDKCDEAIELLEDLTKQDDNPVYIKTLASAYACKAGFSEIHFVDQDIPAIDENVLFQSVSILSYSDESVVDSANYLAMKRAFEILGRKDFKQATRNSDYGHRHGEDMGVQVLVYSLMELGKYLNWYGNVDASGKKGAGTNTNTCYLNYTYAPAIAVVTALPATNACQSTSGGHPDLNGASKVKRVCEGLTLITNIIDTINNIDLSGSSSLSSLEDIVTEVNSYKAAATAAGVGYLLDVTAPAACETLLANTSDMNNAELLFALVLEKEHE